ncbi:NAD-dependent histone deacetylase SIR2 [Myriangium duriaei CBS 260.36]|uniref:NAD-dependent histone deacetylase SIR2 n=1 Tax=Myriangium duriaei CBS 260.36 TaxID=1168546 RepID=A0A9P4MNB6_9PEZI|nr:NAD-dependent histone deacetylase SIR2 [Myriangium duriaei CBS 260.36]
MEDKLEDERPSVKRSKSDQIYSHPKIEVTREDDQSDSSALSAPSRMEGHAEEEPSDDEVSVTSSLFEDVMDEAEDRPYCAQDDEEGLTVEEAKKLKARLRSIGPQQFIKETLESGLYSLRLLATAFGVRPDLPFGDSYYLHILGLCLQREFRRRQKLEQYNTVDDAVHLLLNANKILVITGAGISTSLGIPDFRSKNTGFYSQLLERGFAEPEEVFDLHRFDEDPSVFYSLAKEILPVTDRCSITHAFIRLLQDKQKLLTNYTQNIDNIEQFAGITEDKLIQCHGSWKTASCRKCGHMVQGTEIFEYVKRGTVPTCKVCENRLKVEKPKKRKRGSAHSSRSRKSGFSDDDSDGEYDIPEPGVMKPGITFFHEKLPNTFFDRLVDQDKDLVDLVVVIGTSMKVSPVNEVPNFVAAGVPHIYISREPVSHINFDIQLLGYCDDVVSELSRRAGWTIEHEGFSDLTKANIEEYEGGTGHYWHVTIPGTQHTAQETANSGA